MFSSSVNITQHIKQQTQQSKVFPKFPVCTFLLLYCFKCPINNRVQTRGICHNNVQILKSEKKFSTEGTLARCQRVEIQSLSCYIFREIDFLLIRQYQNDKCCTNYSNDCTRKKKILVYICLLMPLYPVLNKLIYIFSRSFL